MEVAAVFILVLFLIVTVRVFILRRRKRTYVRGILIYLFSLFLCISLLFLGSSSKREDMYIIRSVELSLVRLQQNTVKPMDSGCIHRKDTVGIALKIYKEYVPGPTSERGFFTRAIEPGLNGLRDSIQQFDISLTQDGQQDPLNGLLTKVSGVPSGEAESKPYGDTVTLTQFVKALQTNQRHVSGVRYDSGFGTPDPLYFWFLPMDRNPLKHGQNTIRLDFWSGDTQIHKALTVCQE